MTNEAGQEHAIQTFDQQLYAIAQQVKWSKPDIKSRKNPYLINDITPTINT
jgi:hypothetical protein